MCYYYLLVFDHQNQWNNSYSNNEPIQIIYIELMNAVFGWSVSFGSKIRSKLICRNTYTGRRSNMYSKLTPIHGPMHNIEINLSYYRRNFSQLLRAVFKTFINSFSHQFSHSSATINPVITCFSTYEKISQLKICYHSIIIVGEASLYNFF